VGQSSAQPQTPLWREQQPRLGPLHVQVGERVPSQQRRGRSGSCGFGVGAEGGSAMAAEVRPAMKAPRRAKAPSLRNMGGKDRRSGPRGKGLNVDQSI
jgi:hypothetical protein